MSRHARRNAPASTRPLSLALSTLAAAVLAACGGGGSDTVPTDPVAQTVTVAGVVADGPLAGATVCYDLNDNAACDAGEPSAVTDADGKYSFDIDTGVAGKHAVIASVPATAVDKDTGQPVGAAFTLKSPPTGTSGAQEVFVSPLTTLVVEVAAAQGVSAAEAVSAVQGQLGLTSSPLANFVSANDAQAAVLARTVNTVIVEVTKLADNAAVAPEAKAALVASVSSADLSSLAALVRSSAGSTPAEVAASVSQAVLADRNLSAESVAEQAATALAVAMAPPPTATTGPFVSVRRFAFTDANNYVYQGFVGDNTPGADGTFLASEIRANVVAGTAQPFNRNTAYWNKSTGAWEVCPLAWQIVRTKPQTATAPQESTFCGGSRSTSRITETDVSGQRMADVVAGIRASSLRDVPGADTDATGLPVKWGADPALLGDAVFPAGSTINKREQVAELGDTDRYSLTDLPRVAPVGGVGSFRMAAGVEDLKRMSGNLADPAAVVSNSNTIFLDDLPVTQADATLSPIKRYRAALSGDAVRYYACDVVAATNNSKNCEALGDGSSAVTPQADSRVLRFSAGYPAALLTGLKRQRILVERSGAIFGGYRDLERKHFGQRPNTTAWNALRTALAIPEHAAPAAPEGAGPFTTLRNFSYSDANNYSYRVFEGDSSVQDAQGYFLADELRVTRSGGFLQAYARNALYWTGASWFDCGSTGTGINRINSKAPFDSSYCDSYLDERLNSVTVTLAGRNMADVVNGIRAYASKDIAFDYANWGPNPSVHTQLSTATFPAGATMEYRGTLRKATPVSISTAASSQVRVPPADASVPFNTWPFAATLDEFVAKYPGDLLGGALNGASAFFVHSRVLSSAPAPEYTSTVQIRVAFDANGNKARFWQANVSAATGFSTNYVKLLDTTYTVETVGGKKVLKFAALPEGFEAEFGFQRMFAEHGGSVWYAFKDYIPAGPSYSIRMNLTAAEALGSVLGINDR